MNELLSISRKLFFSKGYEKTTVSDIIDEIGIAKGTFYHYFKSKEDLLDKLVENFNTDTYSAVDIIVKSDLSPLKKFEHVFKVIKDVKTENYDLMITLLDFMYDEKNILFKEKLYKNYMRNLSPVLTTIIEEGSQDGSFRTFEPETTAEIILSLFMKFGELLGPMWKRVYEEPEITLIIELKGRSLVNAIERILGVQENILDIFDEEVIEYFKKRILIKD